MAATIPFDDLTPEQRKQLGVRAPRQTDFTKEEMRSWALKTLASMKGLKRLYLAETKVTDEGVQRLQKALPACEIVRAIAED